MILQLLQQDTVISQQFCATMTNRQYLPAPYLTAAVSEFCEGLLLVRRKPLTKEKEAKRKKKRKRGK